ncbi:neuroguidin [Hetaerina americana]|uniref:neuroguidin n=1 Tax=Hetaerina americana TaxID=62018 RepID=UPI003A7F4794
MVQALEEIVGHDIPEALQLMQEMGHSFRQVAQLVDNMLDRVKRGEVSTAKGLSFLEVKYHMLLSYLINLTYVILRKCSGEKIEGDPAIARLVEIRTVMEKMRPMEHKLKYHIDKLVKTAVSGKMDPNDPLQYKPHPENFLDMSSEDEDDSEEDDGKEDAEKNSKKGIYVPPRIRPMHFDAEESRADKEQHQVERARRRALGSAFLQELREEYLDAPVEEEATMLCASSSSAAVSKRSHASHKKEYEEEYFTRLPTTRVERHKNRKSLTTLGTLGDEVINFGEGGVSKVLEGLEGSGVQSGSSVPSAASRKRKKLKGSMKGKKKGMKKRRYQ